MTKKIPQINNSICSHKINRNYANPNSHKFTISINSPHMQKGNALGKTHKREFKTITSSLYFNGGLVTTNNFSNLTHIHLSYFNNINKEIPVESFVGSSTGIFVS